MAEWGLGPTIELAPGITFECLVGNHNGARNLTTGIVTLDPGAMLPYHIHEFSESITLLSGHADVEVEGRAYSLSPFDNITIRRRLAHAASNPSKSESCLLHVALPTDQPTQLLIDREFAKRNMAGDCLGRPEAERVTRCRTAPRYRAGPNTSFVDYFNSELLPDIEMSGGYALFDQGGRLPAHVHDFDESITIVQGTAICIVEGRRYMQSNYATALQPRGRVHYFVNELPAPMAMIWVYAGPKPERIIVDERCATLAGNPWKLE
jgi:quercetin dioxygenase-like cupin family protein